MGEDFFLPDKEVFRSNSDGLQGKRRSMAGKRPFGQRRTVVNTGS